MNSTKVGAAISDETAMKLTTQAAGLSLNIDDILSEYTASHLKIQ
jgi:hypothetical protein